MKWSPQQESALDNLGRWLDEPLTDSADQVRYMAGYAGTGKTTLAKHLAAQCRGRVVFAAYTGKAAYVMRSKGCTDARTIHGLIYKPAGESKSDGLKEVELRILQIRGDIKFGDLSEPDKARAEIELRALETARDKLLVKERRRPMFSLNRESDLRGAKALILDECSMVDDIIGADLESFGIKILALGDPAQLPPVAAGGRYTKRTPDVLLTEVHRHAKDSGILRLATDVREGRGIDFTAGVYGEECIVHSSSRMDPALKQKLVMEADQVLVGRNATRHKCNARYRELSGKTDPLPMAGDKVVCLKNDREAGLLNGSLWRVHEAEGFIEQMVVQMVISSEEDGSSGIEVASHAHHFMGQEEDLKKMQWNRNDYYEFDYGYALTVHKAQGSQWDDVALFDESQSFRADKQRWLYTGITRAAKNLSVIV
jgi:exodeoxyribonuclease-5